MNDYAQMVHIHQRRGAAAGRRPVGIVGASGYVGRELGRLLESHPALAVQRA
jgi:hypothetical protein